MNWDVSENYAAFIELKAKEHKPKIAAIIEYKVTQNFYSVDDFRKFFDEIMENITIRIEAEAYNYDYNSSLTHTPFAM